MWVLFNPFQTKWAGLAHTHLQQPIKLSQFVFPAMQRDVYTNSSTSRDGRMATSGRGKRQTAGGRAICHCLLRNAFPWALSQSRQSTTFYARQTEIYPNEAPWDDFVKPGPQWRICCKNQQLSDDHFKQELITENLLTLKKKSECVI